jgi:hypothetical protein
MAAFTYVPSFPADVYRLELTSGSRLLATTSFIVVVSGAEIPIRPVLAEKSIRGR